MSNVKKPKKQDEESTETESITTDASSSTAQTSTTGSSSGATSSSASTSTLDSEPRAQKTPVPPPPPRRNAKKDDDENRGSESGSTGSSSASTSTSGPKKRATPTKKASSSSSSELESEHSSSSSYTSTSSSSSSLETSSSAAKGKGKAKGKAQNKEQKESSSSSDELMTESSSSSSSVRIHKRSSEGDDESGEEEDDEYEEEVQVEPRRTPGIENVRTPKSNVIFKGNAQSGYRRTTPTPNIVLVDSASSSSGSKSSGSDANRPTPGVGVAPGDIEMVAVEEDDDEESGSDDDMERGAKKKKKNGDDDEEEEDEEGEEGEDGKKKKKKGDKKKKKKISIIKMIKKPFYHIIYSIRGTTITFFIFVFVLVFIVFGALALYMVGRFRDGDYDLCDDNLNSVIRAMNDDAVKLEELIEQFSEWDDTVEAVKSLNTPNEYFFRQYYQSNYLWDGEWITDMKFNLVAFYDVNHVHLFSEYYPPGTGEVQVVKTRGDVPEFFSTNASVDLDDTFRGVIVMPRPMIVVQRPITYSSQTRGTQGYIIFAKEISPRIKTYAEEISGCITTWIGEDQLEEHEVKSIEHHLKPGYIMEDGEWNGPIHHAAMSTDSLDKSTRRICPDELEFDRLSRSAVGYIKIADEVDIDGTHFVLRVDLPETMYNTGLPPSGLLFGITMACILAFVIIGYVYLDLNVLHRLSHIKKFLEKFKREHEQELAQAKMEKAATFRWRKGNKRSSGMGSSSLGDTTGSSDSKVGATSDSSTGTGTSDKSSTSGDDKNNERDEIGKLGAALILNVHAMERDIAVINRDIRIQRRWRRRFDLACRLMNFWGGRSKAFPGLYSKDPADPDYALTNYNDMTIDVLLSRPICMEFLRTYAETGEVQENILFLLDVSWLKELERAFDEESDVEKRDNIQDIIKDTVTHIFSRYIKSGAPNELNIAGDTMASIRAQEGTYFRGMFSAVIAEIKMLVATDVLIKFKSTAQYAAMSEALDVELHELVAKRPGAFDDYDFKKISSPGKLHDVGIDKDFVQTFQVLLMIDNEDAGLRKKGAQHITATTPTPALSTTPGKEKKSKENK